MQDLTPALIAIVQKYMRDPSTYVAGSTTLSQLEIDLLDLPMICLDIEDAFDVEIQSGDDIDGVTTVQCLAANVAARVAAKALAPRPRSTVPRSTGSWLSTGAGHGR